MESNRFEDKITQSYQGRFQSHGNRRLVSGESFLYQQHRQENPLSQGDPFGRIRQSVSQFPDMTEETRRDIPSSAGASLSRQYQTVARQARARFGPARQPFYSRLGTAESAIAYSPRGSIGTYQELFGSEQRRDTELKGTFFQLQQLETVSAMMEGNRHAKILTQAYDSGDESRAKILAPNEAAISADFGRGREVRGVSLPGASFHPKTAVRRVGNAKVATIGTQNITGGLRGANNVESLLTLYAKSQETPIGRIIADIERFIDTAHRQAEQGPLSRDRVQEEFERQQLTQTLKVNQQFHQAFYSSAREAMQRGGTLYASFGFLSTMLGSYEGRHPDLDNQVFSALAQKGQLRVLTQANAPGGRQPEDTGRAISDVLDRTRRGQTQLGESDTLSQLLSSGAIVDVPTTYYHDKSFSVIEDGETQILGLGSGQLTQTSETENVELGIVLSRINAGEDSTRALDQLAQSYNPAERFQRQLGGETARGQQYLAEKSQVSYQGIQTLERELKRLEDQYPRQLTVQGRYDFAGGYESVEQRLKGLRVTLRSPVGRDRSVVDLTVKNQGVDGEPLVVFSNKDVYLSGSVFANQTRDPMKLTREGGAVETIQPLRSQQLTSIETAVSVIGTTLQGVDIENKFSQTDRAFQAMTRDQRRRGIRDTLEFHLSEAVYQAGLEATGYDGLEQKISYVQGLDQPTQQQVQRLFAYSLYSGLSVEDARASRNPFEDSITRDLTTLQEASFGKGVLGNLFGKGGPESAIEVLESALRQSEAQEDRVSPAQHLKYQVVQATPESKLAYRKQERGTVEEVLDKILEPFFRSGEGAGSGLQALSRLPVFGIEPEDVNRVANNARYIKTGEAVNPFALMNPIALRHGMYLGSGSESEFFRRFASVAYARRSATPLLGGLREITPVDSDKDRQAASVFATETLFRGMSHIAMQTKREYRQELEALQGTIEQETGEQVPIQRLGNLAKFQDQYKEDREDRSVLFLPFGKAEQISQRLSNMIGTRPMLDLNRELVQQALSGSLTEQSPAMDDLLAGNLNTALPYHQFQEVRRVRQELEEQGEEATDEQIAQLFRMRVQNDPGNFNLGYIEAESPRRIAVAMGPSPVGDFSFNNPDYGAEFGFLTRKNVKFNVREVMDTNVALQNLKDRLRPGTVITANPLPLQSDQNSMLRRIEAAYQTKKDALYQRYLNRGYNQSTAEGRAAQMALRQLKTDGTISPMQESFLRISVSQTEGRPDGTLSFELQPGAYQFGDSSEQGIQQVGTIGKEGYVQIGKKAHPTPQGDDTAPITFKVPAGSKRHEKGISIVYDVSDGAVNDNTAGLEIHLANRDVPGSTSRPGTPNIKGPMVFTEPGIFENLQELFGQRLLPGETGARKQLDYVPERIRSKPIYGIYGGATQFKAFNFESGITLLSEPDTFRQLQQTGGKEIATSLSLLFLGDKERGGEIREALSQALPEGSSNRALVQSLLQGGIGFESSGKLDSGKLQDLSKVALGLGVFGGMDTAGGDNLTQTVNAAEQRLFQDLELTGQPTVMEDIRDLVLSSLQEGDYSQLENRFQALMATIQQPRFSEPLTTRSGETRRAFNEGSPVVRGAALTAHLLFTGRQLLSPTFMDPNQGKLYELPTVNVPKQSGKSNRLRFETRHPADTDFASVLLNDPLDQVDPSNLSKRDRDRLRQKKAENTSAFTAIESFLHNVTDVQLRNLRREYHSQGVSQERRRQIQTEINAATQYAHSLMQNQLFVEQFVRTSPSQSLVATGMQDAAQLEYQYMLSYSQGLFEEYSPIRQPQKTDVQTSHAILSRIAVGAGQLPVPDWGESRTLRSESIHHYLGYDRTGAPLPSDDPNAQLARTTETATRFAANYAHLVGSREDYGRQLLEQALEEERQNRNPQEVAETLGAVKQAVRGYQEEYEFNRERDILRRTQQLSEATQGRRLNNQPLSLPAVPTPDTGDSNRIVNPSQSLARSVIEQFEQYLSRGTERLGFLGLSGHEAEVAQQGGVSAVISFEEYLRQNSHNLQQSLESYGFEEAIYNPVSGKLSQTLEAFKEKYRKLEDPQQIRDLKQEYADVLTGQFQKQGTAFMRVVDTASNIGAESNFLNAMRTMRDIAHEQMQSLQGRGMADSDQYRYYQSLKQSLESTREIVIPRVQVDEQGRGQFVRTDEAPPASALMIGLDLLDNLSLEYPGFSDKYLKEIVRLQQINERLLETDKRLVQQSGQQESGAFLSPEEQDLLQERESVAMNIRELTSQEASGAIMRRAAGEHSPMAGATFTPIRSYSLHYNEAAVGSRINDVATPLGGTRSVADKAGRSYARQFMQGRNGDLDPELTEDLYKAIFQRLGGKEAHELREMSNRQLLAEAKKVQQEKLEEYGYDKQQTSLNPLGLDESEARRLRDTATAPGFQNTWTVIRNLNRLSDQGIVNRSGAPFAIKDMVDESQEPLDIVTMRALTERQKQQSSLLQFDIERAGTMLAMPGFGSFFTQQGDWDGDTFQLILSQGREVQQKLSTHVKEFSKAQRNAAEIEDEKEKVQRRLREASLSPELQQRYRQRLEALNREQRKQQQRLEESQRNIEYYDNWLYRIAQRQQERRQDHLSKMHQSIRDWTQSYTGLPDFLFSRSTGGRSQRLYQTGPLAGQEVMTTQETADLMSSFRDINEHLSMGREDARRNIQLLAQLEEESRSRRRPFSSQEVTNFGEDYRQLGNLIQTINRLHGNNIQSPGDQLQRAREFLAQQSQIQEALGTFGKHVDQLKGQIMSESEFQKTSEVLGIGGGQIIGEAYNTFVPLMRAASMQRSFANYFLSHGTDTFERFREQFAEQLQRLAGGAYQQAYDRAKALMGGNDPAGFLKGLSQQYRDIHGLVSNIQVIAREGLKPKQQGQTVEDIEALRDEQAEMGRSDQALSAPQTETQNNIRERLLSRVSFGSLSPNTDIMGSFSFTSFEAMRLTKEYMKSTDDTLVENVQKAVNSLQPNSENVGGSAAVSAVALYAETKLREQGKPITEASIREFVQQEVEPNADNLAHDIYETAAQEAGIRSRAAFQVLSNIDESQVKPVLERIYDVSLEAFSEDKQVRQTFTKQERQLAHRMLRTFSQSMGQLDPSLDRQPAATVADVQGFRQTVEQEGGMETLIQRMSEAEAPAFGQSSGTLAQYLLGQVLYENMRAEPQGYSKQVIRAQRSLQLAMDDIRSTQNMDESLRLAEQQSMLATDIVQQRGHLETAEGQLDLAQKSVSAVTNYFRSLQEQGYNVESLFSEDYRGTEQEQRQRLQLNFLLGMTSTIDQNQSMSPQERLAFAQTLVSGFEQGDSWIQRMQSQMQGLQVQLGRLNRLAELNNKLAQGEELTQEEERLYQQNAQQLQEGLGIGAGGTATRQDVAQATQRLGESDIERMREQVLSQQQEDPLVYSAREEMRRFEIAAEQSGRGADVAGAFGIPALYALAGMGTSEELGERSAMFGYDLLQSMAETEAPGVRNGTRPLRQGLFGRQKANESRLRLASYAFRARRVRMAMESQDSTLEGIAAAMVQESSIKAMQGGFQLLSRAAGQPSRPSTGKAVAGNMLFEVIGDAFMMNVARAVSDTDLAPRAEQPDPNHGYVARVAETIAGQFREAARVITEQVREDQEDDYTVRIKNEYVDFETDTKPTVADRVETGEVVLNEEGKPVPTVPMGHNVG